jgi:hypothetical protein
MINWKIKKQTETDKTKEFKRMSKVRKNRRLDILKAFELIDGGESIFVPKKGFVDGRDNYMKYLEHGIDNA